MEINGVAHTFITASDFEASVAFYRQLLPFLGLNFVADTRTPSTASAGAPASGSTAGAGARGRGLDQRRVGLHHQCWRARERGDIDEAHAFLQSIGARIVHGPQDDAFAPGYYSVLFEDPDGIRLEINHVPCRGLFDTPTQRVGQSLD